MSSPFRTTWLLAVLVLLAGGYLVLHDGPHGARPVEPLAGESFTLTPREVQEIEVRRDAERILFLRTESGWRLTAPVDAPAESLRLEALLATMADVDYGEPVRMLPAADRSDEWAAYGLDASAVALRLSGVFGEQVVRLGRHAPLGRKVYLRIGEGPAVYAVPESVLAALPRDADAFRSHELFQGSPAAVRRLAVRRLDGFTQLARDEHRQWHIQQPFRVRADGVRVDQWLEALFALRIRDFVHRDAESASYGLDDAARRVTFWDSPEGSGYTLRVGRAATDTEASVYAQWEHENGVLLVPDALIGLIDHDWSAWRDRRLLNLEHASIGTLRMHDGETSLTFRRLKDGSWQMTVPRTAPARGDLLEEWLQRWSNARAFDFLPADSEQMKTLGLEQPTLRLAFFLAVADNGESPGESATPDSKWLIGTTQRAEGIVHVKPVAMDFIALAPVDILPPLPLNPWAYRCRTVLALAPESVRSITLERAGQTVSIARRDAGEPFSSPEQPDRSVDHAQVERLQALAGALEVEDYLGGISEGDVYGMEPPSAILTFGLSGDAGIRVSLLFGDRHAAGGIYAMIRGREAVFRLSEASRATLLAPLLQPGDE